MKTFFFCCCVCLSVSDCFAPPSSLSTQRTFAALHFNAHGALCQNSSTSASLLAETSVRSPRKLFIFIIYKNIFRIKVSKKYFIYFSKQKHWAQRQQPKFAPSQSAKRRPAVSRRCLSLAPTDTFAKTNTNCHSNLKDITYTALWCSCRYPKVPTWAPIILGWTLFTNQWGHHIQDGGCTQCSCSQN